MKLLLTPLVAASLALPAATQLVSPVDYANKRANSLSNVPFSGYYGEINFQQIHGDLKGKTQAVVKGIAFRQGGYNRTTAVARVLDSEVIVGEGSYTGSPSRTFASNFSTTPVVAMKRRKINFPAWTSPLPTLPPFDAQFPFDAPWAFTGQDGFVWQLKIFSNTATRNEWTYPDASSHPDYNSSSVSVTSKVCRASDQTRDHYWGSVYQTYLVGNKHTLRWYGNYFPKSAPYTVILGTNKVSINIPGLCQPFGVLPVVTSFGGTTNTSGFISTPTLTVPYNPSLVSFTLHSQAFAADTGSTHAIPVVTSLVNTNKLPAQPTKTVPCAYLYRNGAGSTSATSASSLSTDRALMVQLMN